MFQILGNTNGRVKHRCGTRVVPTQHPAAWLNLDKVHFHKYQLTGFANPRRKGHINQRRTALGPFAAAGRIALAGPLLHGTSCHGQATNGGNKDVPIQKTS